MDGTALRRRQKVNRSVAKCIPPLMAGMVAYASYVLVGPLTVGYLINTPSNAGVVPRIPAAIAVTIVYFVLLLLMAAAYFRLLWVVSCDPGFVPEGDRPPEPEDEPEHGHRHNSAVFCGSTSGPQKSATHGGAAQPWLLDYEGILKHSSQPPPGLERFYEKDVFVCDQNGLPLWCGVCCNWKPDRAHHCSDIGHCVMKMDHFCPWVGGVVGENGYKFFMQFVFYGTIYNAFTMVLFAYFVAETRFNKYALQIQWVVVVGLAGFFLLFSMGMLIMGTQMTLANVTTIENIDRAARSMFLAVALPPEMQGPQIPPPPAVLMPDAAPGQTFESGDEPVFSEIDDPSHAEYFQQASRLRLAQSSSSGAQNPTAQPRPPPTWVGTITYPLWLPPDRPPLPAPKPRTFAILRTPPGMNPWDLDFKENFTTVFGHKPHHFLLPVRRSECTDHSSSVAAYPLGWQFQELLLDAGLMQEDAAAAQSESKPRRNRHRKRVPRLSEGWQNGERPDGWISEKEARRVRNEQRLKERSRT